MELPSTMRKPEVYLSWANSVLCEVNRSVDSVGAVQDGKILCELIDILAPDAGLMAKIQASDTSTQRAYIQTALDHMKNHGIKITFSAQDIVDGDIKSLLDVMWLLILNYGIHFIGQNAYQRSVGIGKKNLLEWCQGELEFVYRKLVHQASPKDKVTYLYKLLEEIEERYGIRRTIISPNDIIDGTVDEHTLMIYLSLLKRRVCNTARSSRREMLSVDGKEAALARIQERNRSMSEEAEARRRMSELAPTQNRESRPTRSASVDSSLPQVSRAAFQARSQESVEDGSDWFSSSNGSLVSGRERNSSHDRGSNLQAEAEQVLLQTISERVKEHMPNSDRDEDKDTDASHSHSERETETLSEFSSSALDEGYVTQRKDQARSKKAHAKDLERPREQTSVKRPAEKDNSNGSEVKKPVESRNVEDKGTVKIKIKRPTDYYLQWEETIDRLSHGPLPPPDVSDMSPRSPREILGGIGNFQGSRSRSLSQGSDTDLYSGAKVSVLERGEYFERRSGSSSPSSMQRRRGRGPAGGSRSLSWDHPSYAPERQVGTQRERTSSSPSSSRVSERTYSLQYTNGRVEPVREMSENGRGSVDKSQRNEEGASRGSISLPSGGSEANNQAYGNLLERLEELSRSGRAQRVILPDLGPDAPVLMIPGQGQEVLLLFDALRRARLEVDLSMPKSNGNGGSPSQPSGPQATEGGEETDLKKLSEREEGSGGGARKSPPTTSEAQDTVTSLPRPTPHQHHSPKPADIRVADLRSGGVRDARRTQSPSKRATSPLVTNSADSSRYQSLSPQRELGPEQAQSRLDRSSLERNGSPLRDFNSQSRDRRTDWSSTGRHYSAGGNSSSPSGSRRYESSPLRDTLSPSGSPYRHSLPKSQFNYQSSSPLRPHSPRSSPLRPHSSLSSQRINHTPERLPRLNLPEDNDSPRPRVGGLGRVPRREAWERQRQRKETPSFDTSNVDSIAQAKFIEILCKEIEELKHKIEDMEDSQVESSPERRGSPARGRQALENGYAPSRTGQNELSNSYSIRSEIQETDNKMLLARRDTSLSPRRPSPRRWQATTASRSLSSSPRRLSPVPRTGLSSSNQPEQTTSSSGRVKSRQTPPPERGDNLSSRKRTADAHPSDGSLRLHARSESPTENGIKAKTTDVSETGSTARSGRAISLGYKSPIRSVTQEIWGKDLTSVEGLEPDRHETYRRLISLRNVSEEDVIELKQALASAVVENDILQAKLNNARHEIQGKLSKTNEVLDDCRRHLAKSQAENMELRTALERERERSATLEGRVREMDIVAQQARADNEELEEELDHTLSMLDRSLSETKPGIDALKQENAELHGQATVFQTENSSLKREMDELRRSHTKAVHTIRELRTCLDEAREERDDLQQRVHELERSQSESKVQSILSHYQEKGARDETEREYNSSGLSQSSDRFTRNHRRTSTRNDEVTPGNTPSKGATPNVSGIAPRVASPVRGLNYSFEEVSAPTVPSTYREIYPHRKPRYQSLSAERYASPERVESPVNFIDYPDLQHYPTKLDPVDLGDSYLSRSQQEDEGGFSRSARPTSRDSSPIRKPIPSYRPYRSDTSSSYTVLAERSSEVLGSARSTSPQTRGRSPVRLSQSMREVRSSSQSPRRGLSSDTLNRSYDSLFDRNKMRSASTSPGRYGEGRRGILKNGSSASSHPRDRSLSPRYASRSHSPPTRLSPENKKDKPAAKKKLMFTKTEAGEIARNLQREFDKEDSMLDKLRQKHSTKSWFELQL
ncbi:hypothetical protein BaRGS_00010252 [Batillaria attramentaria]|uniref:Calponin-homology (CH) domain-containing protein n=1 Tax=Batillaria attramentaria TaxID=370345 RepID=A0ABD0LGX4_9CAEN